MEGRWITLWGESGLNFQAKAYLWVNKTLTVFSLTSKSAPWWLVRSIPLKNVYLRWRSLRRAVKALNVYIYSVEDLCTGPVEEVPASRLKFYRNVFLNIWDYVTCDLVQNVCDNSTIYAVGLFYRGIVSASPLEGPTSLRGRFGSIGESLWRSAWSPENVGAKNNVLKVWRRKHAVSSVYKKKNFFFGTNRPLVAPFMLSATLVTASTEGGNAALPGNQYYCL